MLADPDHAAGRRARARRAPLLDDRAAARAGRAARASSTRPARVRAVVDELVSAVDIHTLESVPGPAAARAERSRRRAAAPRRAPGSRPRTSATARPAPSSSSTSRRNDTVAAGMVLDASSGRARDGRGRADPYRDLAVIDSRAPRTNQAVVGVVSVLAVATGWWWLLALLAAQLALGLTFGRRFCLAVRPLLRARAAALRRGRRSRTRGRRRVANMVGLAVLARLGRLRGRRRDGRDRPRVPRRRTALLAAVTRASAPAARRTSSAAGSPAARSSPARSRRGPCERAGRAAFAHRLASAMPVRTPVAELSANLEQTRPCRPVDSALRVAARLPAPWGHPGRDPVRAKTQSRPRPSQAETQSTPRPGRRREPVRGAERRSVEAQAIPSSPRGTRSHGPGRALRAAVGMRPGALRDRPSPATWRVCDRCRSRPRGLTPAARDPSPDPLAPGLGARGGVESAGPWPGCSRPLSAWHSWRRRPWRSPSPRARRPSSARSTGRASRSRSSRRPATRGSAATSRAAIDFRLRKKQHLEVWMDHDGKRVSTIVRGRTYPEGEGAPLVRRPRRRRRDDPSRRELPAGHPPHGRSPHDHAAEQDRDRHGRTAGATSSPRRSTRTSRPTATGATTCTGSRTRSTARATRC